MWPVNLSVRLPIAGLVSRYLTNYLIGRELISGRAETLLSISDAEGRLYAVLATVSRCYSTA
jgi:hypothetical protein